MDLTLVAIPAFLGLLALELAVARARGRDIQTARDTWTSLAMGLGSVLIGLAWVRLEHPIYGASQRFALFDLGSGPWAWLGAIVGVDFAYYWFHRLHHELRVLWASHVPHHSSQRYNLATALRQSWTPFTALPFYLPLVWIGLPIPLVAAAHGINLLYQFWIHTELIDRLGPVEWIFNTPSHHRVHHGANVRYLDRNYGGILIVWDRWFGTFEPERERVRYGLTKNIASFSPPYVAFHEWVAVFRDALGASSLRAALGYLLRPPGWQPDGSGATATELKRFAAPLAFGALRKL